MSCPLCGAATSEPMAEVRVDALSALYEAKLHIPVRHHFPPGLQSLALRRCTACDLRWFEPLCPGDEAFYQALQPYPWYYQRQKSEFPLVAALVRAGDRVLEVGCAEGALAHHLAQGLAQDIGYVGLEFNSAAAAQGVLRGVDIQVESVQAHADRVGPVYDLVCSFQVLEHLADPRGFLGACTACLKPGGRLLVGVPAEDSFLAVAEGHYLNMPPHHLTRWTDRALLAACTALGLLEPIIWHEPLEPASRPWYDTVLAHHGLRQIVGSRVPLLADRLWSRVYWRLARWPKVRRWLLARGLRWPYTERGHTVCVTARKPA